MNYGFLLALAFAFAVAVLAILLPLAEFEVDVLLAVELTAPAAGLETGLATGLAAGAVLAGLLVALFVAASPQAIPRALKPRTVESAITFFILINDSCLFFSKNKLPVSRSRPIKHSRFAPNSFFFRANDNIEIPAALVNLKITKQQKFFVPFRCQKNTFSGSSGS
jgi:hypothetical protein